MPPKNAKGKTAINPSNSIKKKVTLSPQVVSDAVARSLATDIPSSVKVRSLPKRKASNPTPESDSEVQIIDNPSPSPKKRRTAAAVSPASKVSAPTTKNRSLAAVLDAALNFVPAPDPTAVPSSPAPSGRPVRSKVKTEKLRLAEEAAAEEETTPKAASRKSLKQVNAEASAARTQWENRHESSTPTPKASRKPVASSSDTLSSSALEDDDDDLPEVSELSRSPSKPRKRTTRRTVPDSDDEVERELSPPPATPPPSSDNPFIDAEAEEAPESDGDAGEDDGEEVDAVIGEEEDGEENGVDNEGVVGDDGDDGEGDGDGEGSSVAGKEKVAKGKGKSEPAEVDEDTVMQPSMCWEEIAEIYEDLPYLEKLCDIIPYSSGNNTPSSSSVRAPVDMMASAIEEPDILGLLLGLQFVQSGIYVNTARIDPKALWADSSRLKIAGTKQNAVGIMIGMVTDCAVVSSTMAGVKNAYNVHRIAITPAPQEYRRDVSVWGKVLGFTTIHGPSSDIGLSFSTYGEGKAPSFSAASSPVTPNRSRFIKSVQSPLVSKAVSLARVGQTLSYETLIPLYDGRASKGTGFTFSDDDFKKLQSWPLYEKNKHDLPPDTVVALGYTVGTYSSNNTNEYLSPNIQFAIVLGIPSATI